MDEIDIGQFSEVLSRKADTDLGNVSNMTGTAVIDFVNLIYPIGSIYLSVNEVNPSTFLGGTWEKVSAGRVLQGTGSGQTAGSTIEAGLPNITGGANVARGSGYTYNASGCFYDSADGSGGNWDTGATCRLSIDASRSSSIYGKSSTVQPPAFLVNIWKRTA